MIEGGGPGPIPSRALEIKGESNRGTMSKVERSSSTCTLFILILSYRSKLENKHFAVLGNTGISSINNGSFKTNLGTSDHSVFLSPTSTPTVSFQDSRETEVKKELERTIYREKCL